MPVREFDGALDAQPSVKEFTGSLDAEPSFKDRLYAAAAKLFRPHSVMEDYTGPGGTYDPVAAAKVDQIIKDGMPSEVRSYTPTPTVSGPEGVLEVGARQGLGGLAKSVAGAIRAAGDFAGSDEVADYGADAARHAARFQNAVQLKRPQIEGFTPGSVVNDLPQAVASAGGSILQNLPSLAVGAITAPAVGLGMMGAQDAAGEYSDGRAAGLTPTGAILRAIPHGAAEVIGEKVGGFGGLSHGIRDAVETGAVLPLAKAMVKAGVRENPGEQLTTGLEFLLDKAPGIGLQQDATLQDYLRAAKDTALTTMLQSGAMVGTGMGLAKVAEKARTPARQIAAAINDAVESGEFTTPADAVARQALSPDNATVREFNGQLDPVPGATPEKVDESAPPPVAETADAPIPAEQQAAGQVAVQPLHVSPTEAAAGAQPLAREPDIGVPGSTENQELAHDSTAARGSVPEMAAEIEKAVPAPAMLTEHGMQIEQPTEGLRPGDIIHASGKPFATKAQALPEARAAGPGWQVKKGGGGFVVRYQPQTDKQIANTRRLVREQNQVDPERDSMFAAIAKMGGIRTDDLTKHWGFDPAEFKSLRGAGIKRVVTRNGMSLERAAEALAELGYLSYDEHGKHDLNELFDLFDGELRGNKHYTPQGFQHVYRAQEQALMEELSQKDITASGLDNLPEDAYDAIETYLDDHPDLDYEGDGFGEELRPKGALAGSGRGGLAQDTGDPAAGDSEGNHRSADQTAASPAAQPPAAERSGHAGEGTGGLRPDESGPDADIPFDEHDDRVTEVSRSADVPFSRGGPGALSAEDVRAAITADTFHRDVDVYASMADAPRYIREQAEAEGATDVEGFFDPHTNRVALIAENLASPERAREVARHELIGHYGLENMVGAQEMKRLARRVLRAEADGNRAIVDVAHQVDDTQPGLDGERRAKEIIAVMAERNLQNNIVKRVIDAIRTFLNKIGAIKSDMTDAEIAGLLREAQAYLREQGRPMVGGEPAPAFSKSAMKSVEANIARGREALQHALLDRTSVTRAMFRTGLGWVDFVWGDAKKGLQHILVRRVGADGMTESEAIRFLSDRIVPTIAQGRELRRQEYGGSVRAVIEHDGAEAVLVKNRGSNSWVLSGWEVSPGASKAANDTKDTTHRTADSSDGPVGAGDDNSLSQPGRFSRGQDVSDLTEPTALEENRPLTREEVLAKQEADARAAKEAAKPVKASKAKEATGEQVDLFNSQGSLFSRAAEKIDHSQDDLNFGPRQSFEVAEAGVRDHILRAMQDNKIDLKRVQQAIEEAGGKISENADTYLNEELYIGRVTDLIDRFVAHRVTPLLEAIKDSGLTLAEVNQYLYARHAPERNAQLKKINPHRINNDRLSGMSDARAAEIIGEFRQAGKLDKLHHIAAMVDKITTETRRRIVSTGLENAETVGAWEVVYKHYVPLMQDMDVQIGKKKGGYNVKGPESQRALGQLDEAQNVLANVIAQAQSTIMRAEKAKVGRSLLDLARQFPHDDFWRVDEPPKKRRINPDTGLVEWAEDPLFKARDNVLVVKENGVEHYLVFNEKNERAMRIAAALQNLDVPTLPWVVDAAGKLTRSLAQWITSRNPLFWVSNFARDVQHAVFNLSDTPISGKEGQVLKNILPAMRGYRQMLRGDGEGRWADYAREFKSAGAETGFVKTFDSPADHMADLEKQLKQMQQGVADPRRVARAMVDMIDDYNHIIENGVRLAVYQAARENGVSIRRAASLAKNITVNFNRRGNQSTYFNALYMFMNANIQGHARLFAALGRSRKAQALAGALVGMGFLLDVVGRAVGGDDDKTGRKKYDEIPEWEKEKNWIFMFPDGSGRYVKIPMPQGPHVMVNMGRVLSESLFSSKKRTAVEGALSLARIMGDAFNPSGSAGSFSQFIAPSIAKPIVQASENKTFTGSPMYREGDDRHYVAPAYTRHFRSTADHWIEASKLLNDATGGDQVKPGAVDVPPEVLRTMFLSYVAPGVLQAADKTVDTAVRASRGEKIEPSQVPAASKFYGVAPEERAQERAYYQEGQRIKQAVEQAKRYMQAGQRDKADATLAELGDGDIVKGRRIRAQYAASEKGLLELGRVRKQLENDRTPDERQRARLDHIDAQRLALMQKVLR